MTQALARPLARLIDELSKLPGVGPKTAQRLAYHILRASMSDADALASAVRSVKTDLRYCSTCWNIAETDPCALFAADVRNTPFVCAVDEPLDRLAIDRPGRFKEFHQVPHVAMCPVHISCRGLLSRTKMTSRKSVSPGSMTRVASG